MTLESDIAARTYQYKHGDRPLEGFTIQRAAGRGGFGEVYYAVSDSGREVALKLVLTYEQIELRGISQCMNLKNPHLVSIFDVKYGNDSRPWVIMEFVSGPSLKDLLDASPSGLGEAKAAFFLREIGKGLIYLHDCGIVHRDLKPGNIFYEDGYVKIGDYGLSKAMSMTRHSGQTVAVGTLHYMAPEIGEGNYDRTIDIYAMGALLYEMITGQVPFHGSSPAEVLMKHLTSAVDLTGIAEPFQSVIRKAMAKNPEERFQSAQEMVEAVFGSEQVRNSVSQFSPASLTQVAGRAARNVGAAPGAFTPPPQQGGQAGQNWQWGQGGPGAHAGQAPRPDNVADRWEAAADRFAAKMHSAGERMQRAGERFAERMTGKKRDGPFLYPRADSPDNRQAPMLGREVNDSFSPPIRTLLALSAAVLAAFFASVNADSQHGMAVLCMVFLGVCGAEMGARFAWRQITPAMSGESKWFQRIALGAPAAFGAAILSFPIWAFARERSFNPLMPMEASFVALLLLEWNQRIAPSRKERFSIGHLFTSAILAAILSGMFGVSDAEIVVGIVVGASLAASLRSPWNRFNRFGPPIAQRNANRNAPPIDLPTDPHIHRPDAPPQSPGQPSAPPIPGAQPAPFAPNPQTQKRGRAILGGVLGASLSLIFISVALGNHNGKGVSIVLPIMIAVGVVLYARGGSMFSSSAASRRGYADSMVTVGGVASSVAHGILSFVGSILLIVSLVLVVAITSNLPGLFSSGALDPRMPAELTRNFGTPNWPDLCIEIGSLVSFVTAAVAIVLLTFARRRRGGLHIVRGIVAMPMLFFAALILGHALPDWQYFIHDATPGAAADWFFKNLDSKAAIACTMIASIGYTLLLWPPRRRQALAPIANANTNANINGSAGQ